MRTEVILGIDLGTSYSTAAAWIDGKMHFALDGRGEAAIPSVVHFPKSGAPVVGFEADKMRATDPANTVFGIKRLVGQTFESGATRLVNHSAPFKLKSAGPGEVVVQVAGGDRTASEVAAIILQNLKEKAEARIGGTITKTVLTVPVTATRAVRDAMIRVGRMANLEVVNIITEPHAGALSLGAKAALSPEPFLVYDFGGGTFDVAVLQYTEGAMRVLASGGEEGLGGDDLDFAFARFIADQVQATFRKDVAHDIVAWDRLLRACELVKRALSRSQSSRLFVQDAFSALGKGHNLNSNVDRQQLYPIWHDMIQRSVFAAKETLTRSGVLPEKLSRVLMIGGTSFVPQVQDAVRKGFRVEHALSPDPQVAVAMGAAVVARKPELAGTDDHTPISVTRKAS